MRSLVLAVLAVCGAALLATPALINPPRAGAHPLGNFTVSRYSRVELTPGLARVRYVVDMAEIPAFQERSAIDTNRDGQIDDQEAEAYAVRQGVVLASGVHLTVDGQPVALRLSDSAVSFPAGQGGLNTLRLEAWFAGEVASLSGAVRAEYRDENYGDRLGWKEVVVRGGPGIEIGDSSVPDADVTNELRSYPEDMLQRPLDQRSATFSMAPGAGRELSGSGDVASSAPARKQDRFARLITREQTLPVFLISLLVAMGLGALHALGPGHGKTVVAAYLVGSRGTTMHACFLGVTVTLTHTSSVFALGLVTLYLSDYILPEQLFPWLSFLSGASIAALGMILLASRGRALLAKRRAPVEVLRPGMIPEPAHAHIHGPFQTHSHSRTRGYAPAHDHEHSHDGPALHSHGGRPHAHVPPGASGERVTWRSLVALGISGGLLPCPSALVVLLTAISLHRIGYGMLLILAFSVGLAGVLTGIGLLLVHARGLFSRLPLESTLARALPVVSAAVVMTLGIAIAVRALTGGSNLSV